MGSGRKGHERGLRDATDPRMLGDLPETTAFGWAGVARPRLLGQGLRRKSNTSLATASTSSPCPGHSSSSLSLAEPEVPYHISTHLQP